MGDRVGFGLRFAAILIDVVFLGIIYGLFYFLVDHLDSSGQISILDLETKATIIGAQAIIFMMYFLTDYVCSGTPGKLVLGLRIRNQSGGMASLSQLSRRLCFKNPVFAAYLILILIFLFFGVLLMFLQFLIPVPPPRVNPALIYVLNLIGIAVISLQLISLFGYLMVFGDNHQALHDFLTDTAVFRTQSRKKDVFTEAEQAVSAIEAQKPQIKAGRPEDELIFE